ncbi:hypothetical protein AAEH74_22115, partial [Shewanella algae]
QQHQPAGQAGDERGGGGGRKGAIPERAEGGAEREGGDGALLGKDGGERRAERGGAGREFLERKGAAGEAEEAGGELGRGGAGFDIGRKG